ncbi:MAG TPA: hypothetical protein VEN79_00165 [Terriglobia bacterium]|nr:hypothetical protein [Terriglobia bacterium]
MIRNNSYLESPVPCDILKEPVGLAVWGDDRDSDCRIENSDTLYAQQIYVEDWNRSGNLSDIKDYWLGATFLTLFFYFVEKVV